MKAAVDGLVDAKVIADDTGEQVAWYRLWPPSVTGRDALTHALRGYGNAVCVPVAELVGRWVGVA